MLGDRLAALGAGHVAEDTCPLGYGPGGLREGEHLLYRGGEQPVLPGRPVHAAVTGLYRHPQPSAALAAVEGKDHLAGAPVDEIALAHGAAGDDLHRVHGAGVVLSDAHQLLVGLGAVQTQLCHGLGGHPEAGGQTGTLVTVKFRAFVPESFIHEKIPPFLLQSEPPPTPGRRELLPGGQRRPRRHTPACGGKCPSPEPS